MRRGSISRIGATLLATTVTLCATSAAGMAVPVAQQHLVRATPYDQTPPGGFKGVASRFAGYDVANPCYLHSLTCVGLPIDIASQQVSSGFAVDDDWLRLISTPVISMAFNTLTGRCASLLAMATGILVGGCGGGASDSSDQSVAGTGTPISTATGTSTTTTDTSSGTHASGSSQGTSGLDTTVTSEPSGAAIIPPSDPVATPVEGVNVAAAVAAGNSAATPAADTIAATRSSVGLNLSAIKTYSSEIPTIDLMKKAAPWRTLCYSGQNNCSNFTAPANAQGSTLEEANLALDANNWVKSLPAATDPTVKYRYVQTTLAEGYAQQAGTYVVVYDGEGTLTYQGAVSKDVSQSKAGRDIINVTKNGGGFVLNIMATNPKNYVRNIRIYMPGGACSGDMTTYVADSSSCTAAKGTYTPFEKFPASTVWHPAFLASVKKFRSLRFMDWAQTNNTLLTEWANRTPATARSWYVSTGVPVEAMFDLAAKTGADPWMNIPPHASDDYVHQFGRLAHTLLPSGSKLWLEYGNEMWNWSFTSTRWAQTQSLASWSASLTTANQLALNQSWYGMRLAQVCNIVKSEFGVDAKRVQCVANTQAANAASTDAVLNCPYAQPTLGQPCYKFIDAVAIAPYVGWYIGSSATVPIMNTWYSDADGGLGKLFEELTGTDASGQSITAPLTAAGTRAPHGALALAQSWMVSQKAVAAKYNLPLLAYEGGQGMVPAPGDAKMLNLMTAANRDPRMGAVYTTMMNQWKAAGGATFAFFGDVGSYGPGGFWGLHESQFDTVAPKWVAATQWRDSQPCWWSGC